MPNCEKLAAAGCGLTFSHDGACSPTRMALLTGRNHHSCNTGSIMETATAFPARPGCAREHRAPGEILR